MMKQTITNLLLIFQLKFKLNKRWKKYWETKKTLPTLPPPYVPPPLSIKKEIETGKNKENHDFVKTSLQLNKDQLDAANEFADQKNKKKIRDIIHPKPGLFIDDKIES